MASRRAWLLVLAVMFLATPALAEPTPQQKELARDLMQKGHDARNAHDMKLALESFKGADDIMHVPTTGFEVARSQVDLGLLVEAHETLLSVMRSPEKPGEPAAFHDARGYARVLDDDVATRIPQLRITVQGAAPGHAPAVAVDGVALPEGALLVPYKVDPGHHVVTARADDAEGRAETDVAERQSKDVGVTLAAIPGAPPSAQPPVPAPVEPPAPVESRGKRGLGPIAWTGFGVGAAGIAVGTVTGIMVISDKSSIASKCNGTRCPPSQYDSLSSANTLATVSTVGYVVGAVGVSVGVLAWLLAPDPAPPAAGGPVRVRPWIGLGSVGADGTF